ncbi:MAG: glycosyltransferase family A protein [Parvibaculum sp.]|uniref:glycosyltransferase family 2 protein n=1 Tax=Parvibaculum sp. TaxID=2024848 RepID=UPI00272804B8|nr:glycosyltransferase family A protein [Parvibaculum sp.]MDO8837370.1 glycosyltransferase family A protein [Parvibaculum sp.]
MDSSTGVKVSIVLPAYNAEMFVGDAVNSVLSQTCEDWELIVIDDGSNDGTSEVVSGFNDARIKLIRQPNAGVSTARNRGLRAARGGYITFLDADDLLPPDALKIRAEFLDGNPDVDIVNGSVQIEAGVSGKITSLYRPDVHRQKLFDRLVRMDPAVFFGVCYMLRRACVREHVFPPGQTHAEDITFFLEVAHDEDISYAAVDSVVYRYRVAPHSAMANLDGIESGYMSLLRAAENMHRIGPQQMSYLRRRISSILLKSWLRRGNVWKAIRVVLTVHGRWWNARHE